MKRNPSFSVVFYLILLGTLLMFILGACGSSPESAMPTTSQLSESPEAVSSPTETPDTAEVTPPTITPTEAPPEPTPTPEPSPTPTRLPEDPWGRMTYRLPELAGAITATNLGLEGLAQWGMGYPRVMAFSPDGELFGVETTAGQFIYDAYSMASIPYEDELWNKIFPNGSIVLTNRYMNMRLYEDDELLLDVPGVPYALSPRQGFAAGFDEELGSVTVYGTQDGQTTGTLNLEEQEECLVENWEGKMMPSVSQLAVMENGETLAISCGDTSELALYHINGEKILTFDLEAAGLTSSPNNLQFSPDGSYLAGWASNPDKVFIWETDGGSFVSTLEFNENMGGTNTAFSPDNSKLLAGFAGGQVYLLDPSQPDNPYLLHPESPEVEDLDFSADGSRLLVPFREHFVLLDPFTGQILQDVVLDEAFTKYGGCRKFVFSIDGKQLVCSASRLLVWQTDDMSYPQNAGQRGSELKEVPALGVMALVRENLQLLSPADWQPIDTILFSDRSSGTYDFSPDGKLLALGEYGSVQILSRKEGKKFKVIEELEAENADLLRFSPDGSRLAVIDGHGLRLFDTRTWEQIGSWEDEFPLIIGDTFIDSIESGLYELAFSPDGSVLATGSGDDIHLRRTDTGELLVSSPGHTHLVSALAFSPDGTLLASLSWDGSVRLWGIPK